MSVVYVGTRDPLKGGDVEVNADPNGNNPLFNKYGNLDV